MNHTDTLKKLVSLLGRSENDPEVIDIFTQLGVKLPLKRPKRSEDGYLIEKSKINCYLGVKCANSLPYIQDNKDFKEKELVFSAVQDVLREKFPDRCLPFDIHWDMTLDDMNKDFGNYFDKREFASHTSYMWITNKNIVIMADFSENKMNGITFRLMYDFDLENLDKTI